MRQEEVEWILEQVEMVKSGDVESLEQLAEYLNNILRLRKKNEPWASFWKRIGIHLDSLPNWDDSKDGIYLGELNDSPYSWDDEGNMLFYDYLSGFYIDNIDTMRLEKDPPYRHDEARKKKNHLNIITENEEGVMAELDKNFASDPRVYSTLYAYGQYYYALTGIGGQDNAGRANEQTLINNIGEDNVLQLDHSSVVHAIGSEHDADEELYEEKEGVEAPVAIVVSYRIGGDTVYLPLELAEKTLESLENYPVLDSDAQTNLEHEDQIEEMNNWAWREIKKKLLPGEWSDVYEIDDALDAIDMEDVLKILWDGGLYLQEENSGDGYYIEDSEVDYSDLRALFYGYLRDHDMIPEGAEDKIYSWVNDEEPLEESVKIDLESDDTSNDNFLRNLIREEVNAQLGLFIIDNDQEESEE